MSIGYNPDDFVWSTDLTTGRAAPRRRDLIALNPERYRTDEKHPVVDSRGVLLPGKHPTPKPPQAAPAAKPTTGDAGKEK